MRFSANGNLASKTCTWQSQAPAGTAKLGAVRLAGMSALATPACRAATDTPAAPKLCSMSRLVSMASPPFLAEASLRRYFLEGQGAPQGAQAPAKSSGETARPLDGLLRCCVTMAESPSTTTAM